MAFNKADFYPFKSQDHYNKPTSVKFNTNQNMSNNKNKPIYLDKKGKDGRLGKRNSRRFSISDSMSSTSGSDSSDSSKTLDKIEFSDIEPEIPFVTEDLINHVVEKLSLAHHGFGQNGRNRMNPAQQADHDRRVQIEDERVAQAYYRQQVSSVRAKNRIEKIKKREERLNKFFDAQDKQRKRRKRKKSKKERRKKKKEKLNKQWQARKLKLEKLRNKQNKIVKELKKEKDAKKKLQKEKDAKKKKQSYKPFSSEQLQYAKMLSLQQEKNDQQQILNEIKFQLPNPSQNQNPVSIQNQEPNSNPNSKLTTICMPKIRPELCSIFKTCVLYYLDISGIPNLDQTLQCILSAFHVALDLQQEKEDQDNKQKENQNEKEDKNNNNK